MNTNIIDAKEGDIVRFTSRSGKTITISLETITPEYAEKLLESNKTDRTLSESYVKQYQRDMLNGDWKLNGSTIVIDDEGRRIDGNHRLEACKRSGVPFETLVARDIPNEYKLTVDQGRPRTLADQLIMRGYSSVVSSAIRGLMYITRQDRDESGNYLRLTMVQLIGECEKSPDLYLEASKYALKVNKTFPILSKKVIAGTYVHLVRDLGYNRRQVTIFFSQLASMSTPCAATMAAIRSLNAEAIGRKSGAAFYVQQQIVTKAWNAFVKNTRVDYITFSPKDGLVDFM